MHKRSKATIAGIIDRLDPAFGNGGVGYIKADDVEYFFHCRNVLNVPYAQLKAGDEVTFQPIRAKAAMGASPRALAVNFHRRRSIPS